MFVAVKQIGTYMKDSRAHTFRGQLGRQIFRLDQYQFCCQPNHQQGRDSDD
jgi:hypothetical protein